MTSSHPIHSAPHTKACRASCACTPKRAHVRTCASGLASMHALETHRVKARHAGNVDGSFVHQSLVDLLADGRALEAEGEGGGARAAGSHAQWQSGLEARAS